MLLVGVSSFQTVHLTEVLSFRPKLPSFIVVLRSPSVGIESRECVQEQLLCPCDSHTSINREDGTQTWGQGTQPPLHPDGGATAQ